MITAGQQMARQANANNNMNVWGSVIYNVKAYGAKGDGIKDDTTKILSAIEDAAEKGGGVIYFPPGVYIISSEINIISNGICIVGAGTWSTYIKHTSDTGNLFTIGDESTGDLGTVRGFQFSGIRILHNSTRTEGHTFKFVNAQRFLIKDMEFLNAYKFAVLGSATDIRSNFAVFDNIIGSCVDGSAAFEIYGINGVHLTSVQVNNEAEGIAIRFNSCIGMDTFFIDNCLFQRFNYGIIAAPSEGIIQNGYITNTIFDTTNTTSVVLQPSGTAVVTRFHFGKCWFSGATNDAVLLAASSTSILDGVYFDSSCRWIFTYLRGVQIANEYPENIYFDNCILSNCSRAGSGLYPAILIAAGTKKWAIRGCTIGEEGETQTFQSYAVAISANCDQYQITNNTFLGNITGSIADSGGTFTKKMIKDNIGHNPVGVLTAPGVPATTVAQANTFSCPVQVLIYGGAVTGIAKNGTSITGMTSGSLTLYPGETVTLTYSSAPSWTWFGM